MTNGRSVNKTHYHYKIFNRETNETKYYKTLNHITDEYGISRSNIYLMCKNNDTEINRRKYDHLNIEKIHLHYLVVEQGLDPNSLI